MTCRSRPQTVFSSAFLSYSHPTGHDSAKQVRRRLLWPKVVYNFRLGRFCRLGTSWLTFQTSVRIAHLGVFYFGCRAIQSGTPELHFWKASPPPARLRPHRHPRISGRNDTPWAPAAPRVDAGRARTTLCHEVLPGLIDFPCSPVSSSLVPLPFCVDV